MDKKIVMLGMIIGSTIGGYAPTLFGAGIFSWTSIIGTFIGGVIGIWLFMRFLE